jgi:two-component system, OmpR family, KDP operon response regulator KdpE
MSKLSVVLIDGELLTCEMLDVYMGLAGYGLLHADNPAEGLSLVDEANPDLIILDVDVRGGNGWELCRQLRACTRAPIIILSAQSSEADVLRGFQLGVDDYVRKPFSCAEVVARTGAILNRAGRADSQYNTVDSGEIKIDLENKRVYMGGQRVELTPKEFQLLEVLARHANNTIPIERLLKEVWGYTYEQDARFVKQYIWNLRKKIEDDPRDPKHLITRRGFGYRFE